MANLGNDYPNDQAQPIDSARSTIRRELKSMVERACKFRGASCDPTIVPALNRAGIFRRRAILNVVDTVARGTPIEQAVVGQ